MYQRGTVAVEIKGGCEGYGDMPSVAEGSCGATRWENGLNARMGYSGIVVVVVIYFLGYWCIKGRRDD
eukprot:scaffold357533_cov50-Attheya_sp.AAC.1